MTRSTISPSDLAQSTREILERVQGGELAVVETEGRERVVLMDALDYRLLRALAAPATGSESAEGSSSAMPQAARVVRDYLADSISLAKAAEELGISQFELREHFLRLGVPLRTGPNSIEEAREEAAALRRRA